MNFFVSLPGVADITGQGSTKTSVRLRGGIAVDLRVVSPEQYPYALHHFTGSREHNTRMRHIAKSMGMKMNEYGLFREENGSNIPCSNEADLFQALGMAYIPPELREDMGEIEAALENRLPKLVESSDLKGIFHFHSHYSDGSNSIKELADEVRRQGYQYIGISDHSVLPTMPGGLSEDDIIRQHEEIDELNKRYHDFYIFKGIESDILSGGSLDYSDEFLERFDFVIISIHSQFRMNRESMTKRILKAMDHPAGTILGHATGRLVIQGWVRSGYGADSGKGSGKRDSFEINANPHRLDLDWRWVRRAKEMGIRLMINRMPIASMKFRIRDTELLQPVRLV